MLPRRRGRAILSSKKYLKNTWTRGSKMKPGSNGMAKKIFFIAFTASMFIAALAGVSSEERVKYSEL